MTKIIFKTHVDQFDYGNGLHVLTFAEQGFAPLDIHGRKLGVAHDTLNAFADAVNQLNKVGSLYPHAPISAVPRSCIRDTTDPAPLLRHLREFIETNADHMKATHLLLDFSTPKLQPHAEEAIAIIFTKDKPPQIEEAIILQN